ncbi:MULTISPECIES: phosphomevalonate kinase [unclassified Pseudoclavibacter]|uniref:phosphomevalonate kinase n=1 Tax=unclassified Pseudoclavibacter TaxID=2615177 RepID=UPI0013016382|nr:MULTISPECIES: phosphomevalonate kinase [unclassified Pseudoclavibacter]KAB1658969.1 phosphomevalonate kinase [Pseudoclavibacter sp. CFCC 11306]KAB1660997.1 phosphomevalonate kinase [Pseudoclavibacter sp. CFCC 13796]
MCAAHDVAVPARTTVVRAPGKLYIAGEYAVVEAGYPAVLIAVDRYVQVRVSPARDTGHITSDQYASLSLEWHRRDNDMVIEPDQTPFDFVLAAIRVVEEAAVGLGASLELYDLDITSELDDDAGRKFGLGSSAAVTVATVRALCEHYRLDLTRMEQLKLALIASIEVQRSGSGGDVAASMFGGWIVYRAFDREWVRAERVARPLTEMLAIDWPGLEVRRVVPPDRLRLVVGWTGSPASTARLVSGVQARKGQRSVHYSHFLAESRSCVTELAEALERDDGVGIAAGIRRNRELLRGLGEHSGITIETPKLQRLIETAEACGGAAKTSGAGGGDCGIVLIDRDADIDGMLAAWERADIRPLNLRVHQPEGTVE